MKKLLAAFLAAAFIAGCSGTKTSPPKAPGPRSGPQADKPEDKGDKPEDKGGKPEDKGGKPEDKGVTPPADPPKPPEKTPPK